MALSPSNVHWSHKRRDVRVSSSRHPGLSKKRANASSSSEAARRPSLTQLKQQGVSMCPEGQASERMNGWEGPTPLMVGCFTEFAGSAHDPTVA